MSLCPINAAEASKEVDGSERRQRVLARPIEGRARKLFVRSRQLLRENAAFVNKLSLQPPGGTVKFGKVVAFGLGWLVIRVAGLETNR